MAVTKLLLILSFFLALISTAVRADDENHASELLGSDGSDSSSLKLEFDQLKFKIQTLESQLDEKSKALEGKDVIVAEKEKLIQEKSDSISSLHSEIASLRKKGTVDVEEQVGKAHARTAELEKQVEKLRKELETQKKEKEALESRANEAEKTIKELHKINEEQKQKIRKTERALKVVEEEMTRAKHEATAKAKALMEAHGAWLPPWLAVHLIECQSYVETQWKLNGKPAMERALEKALETKAQAEKWAEPHVETIKTKVIPSIKEQWLVVKTSAEPHLQALSKKTIEVYETSKSTLAPHVSKVQEVVDHPYFQEAKKYSKPYIDQVATAAKPHVEKAQEVLRPYTNKAVHAYGEFLKSATTYHQQVQGTVKETLKRHELTKPLATKEFVWFAASALLALPVIFLFRLLSSIFCGKKVKKPVRNTHTSHGRRKARRGHTDN